jgi:D-inositol-3-phosphate glycosyltransferase
VDGHDPADYATACATLLERPEALQRMRGGARRHAAQFGWGVTADLTLGVYSEAIDERWASRGRVSSVAG